MKHLPAAVAFDVIETVFSLESLRPRLLAAGLPGHMLETWFAQVLRDAFALDATGVYKPFREVATAALQGLFAEPRQADSARADGIIDGFTELDAHPDAGPAMQRLRDAGIRIVMLTNGSAKVTETLLERAGFRDLVERTVTVDEVKHWKPRKEVYLHCAETVGVEPQRLALVAAHAWDIHGGRRAGLITAYVGRSGQAFPATMARPDIVGSTLIEVADRLLAAR